MHPELVKRSIEIAKFLAFHNHLERKYIDMIWESAQVSSYIIVTMVTVILGKT